MCGLCGCGQSGNFEKFSPFSGEHRHVLAHSREQHTPAVAGNERFVKIEQELLGKNNAYAGQNRTYFKQHGIFALNMVSSPGAGKTTLLVETINQLKNRASIAVIEGDQQTDRDAERIRATGVKAVQINTGKLCHLEAKMIGEAVEQLDLQSGGLLFIENIGNLVCPSAFDLGEAHKIVVLSVTEGDDKPLKYPDMFRAADLMIITKIDLLPYVDFDTVRCEHYARQINPEIRIMQLSATQHHNFPVWTTWLEERVCR